MENGNCFETITKHVIIFGSPMVIKVIGMGGGQCMYLAMNFFRALVSLTVCNSCIVKIMGPAMQ